MLNEGVTGQPAATNSNNRIPARVGAQGDAIVSELNGRFYEDNFKGNMFAGGIATLTSISNATFTTGTLGATCTPVAGIWNPVGSGVNAQVLQSVLTVIMTALQATGCGGFSWATSIGNAVISTGTIPLNMSTLQQAGSKCKDMSGIALTGLTNNLVARFGSQLNGGSSYNASLLATAAGFQTVGTGMTENIDGSIIVPPGGVLALLANTTPVAHSAVSRIVWSEKPITT